MLHLLKGVYNNLFYDLEYSILIIGHESSGKTTFLEQVKYIYNPASTTPSSSGGSSFFRPAAAPSPLSSPAPRSYFAAKTIHPTVGLNFVRISHSFSTLTSSSEAGAPAGSSFPFFSLAIRSRPPGEIQTKRARKGKVRTGLVLWDLGGQPSLRVIWENYYAQCRAVIFVIDSTLSDKSELTELDGINEVKKRYLENHETLRELFTRPELRGVPFLLLSNKIDCSMSLSLSVLQEALGLADLVLQDNLYDAEVRNGKFEAKIHELESEDGSESHTQDFTDRFGRSGFGTRIIKLMEISALEGKGVTAAMDWLVEQLIK